MADPFDRLIETVLGHEGGYVNHPADPGGETNWGVTVGVARKYGYAGPMRSMTRDQAKAIYRARYWVEPGFDQVAAISELVAAELFDTGVNMGQSIGGEFLQVCLNGLNRQAKDYPDLKVDGDVGRATREALKAYLRLRGAEGERVLVTALNCLQGARYLGIVAGRPASEAFLYGWLRTRVKLAA